jgi:DNA-binding transcriptional regulator GbsR (MarR family)
MPAPSVSSALPSEERLLTPLETDVIAFFVRLGRLIGAPTSIGEIYGLCFISTRPQTLDDVIDRLAISKGSASQGLRLLRSIGAIKSAYVPGDRRDHFVAETELRKLVSGILREKVAPHLESGAERLDHIGRSIATAPASDRPELKLRINKLKSWHRKARLLLPLVQKFVRED